MTVDAPKVVRRHRSSFGSYFRRNYDLYLILIPGVIYLLIFKLLPLYGISIAFVDYNIFAGNNPIQAIRESDFVGFDQFRRIFAREEFLVAFRNTLVISFLKIGLLFPLPIILALIVNSLRSVPYKKAVQTVIYLPHFFSWVVVAGMFMTLLSTSGPVNSILMSMGLKEPIPFFMSQPVFRGLLIFTEGWKEAGWGTIVYLAAIAGIDQELYEAAVIDGARKFQQLLHITLPSLLSTIVLMLILRVGSVMDAGFTQIFVMYNPTVYAVSDIIQTYVYRMGLGQMDFSLGSAAGLFNSVVGFVLVVSSNWVSHRALGRSIW